MGDYMLTRYACYLIAQNGDPSKDADCLRPDLFCRSDPQAGIDRAATRPRWSGCGLEKSCTASEKELSHIIFERVGG